jgi:hypothetical protein
MSRAGGRPVRVDRRRFPVPINAVALLIQAFHLVRRNRVLWMLGLGMSLLQGLTVLQDRAVGPGSTDSMLLICFLAVLQIVGLFASLGFLAGLIYAADGSAAGTPPGLRTAWAMGSERIGALFTLSLLLLLVLIVPGVVLYMLFGGAGLALMLISALFLPVVYLAQCALVLDGLPNSNALSTGWELMRANLLGVLVIPVAATAGQQLAQALSGLLTGPLLGTTTDPVTDAGARLAVGVAVWLISGLLAALPATWGIVSWTLFYRTASTGGQPRAGSPILDNGMAPPPLEKVVQG